MPEVAMLLFSECNPPIAAYEIKTLLLSMDETIHPISSWTHKEWNE